MEELKERRLKVYDQARGGYYNIPTILLKGHWLEQLGFNIHWVYYNCQCTIVYLWDCKIAVRIVWI